ncbi:hypothetical protein BaRGS_00030716, partial [Batillaria attramentaria]
AEVKNATLNDQAGSLTVSEAQTVFLQCDATGYPTPNVTRSRNVTGTSDVIKGGENWTDNECHRSSRDVLVEVTCRDIGTYTCTASNGLGEPDHKSMQLDVLGMLKVRMFC